MIFRRNLSQYCYNKKIGGKSAWHPWITFIMYPYNVDVIGKVRNHNSIIRQRTTCIPHNSNSNNTTTPNADDYWNAFIGLETIHIRHPNNTHTQKKNRKLLKQKNNRQKTPNQARIRYQIAISDNGQKIVDVDYNVLESQCAAFSFSMAIRLLVVVVVVVSF